MKLLFYIVSLFIAFPAFALNAIVRQNVEAQLVNALERGGVELQIASDFEADPKPIRQASIKIRFEKATLKTLPNGTETYVVSKVCQATQKINVYETRKGDAGLGKGDYSIASCPADYLGERVTLWVGGALALASRELFDSKPQDYKVSYPFLWYEYANAPKEKLPIVSVFSGTTDLDSHSPLLSYIQPPLFTTCDSDGKCKFTLKEYFSAVVEIGD